MPSFTASLAKARNSGGRLLRRRHEFRSNRRAHIRCYDAADLAHGCCVNVPAQNVPDRVELRRMARAPPAMTRRLMRTFTGILAEFERSIIRLRVHAGLKRAVKQDKTLDRPCTIQARARFQDGKAAIRKAVPSGTGIRKTAAASRHRSSPTSQQRGTARDRDETRFPPHRCIGRFAEPDVAFTALKGLQVREAASRRRARQVHRSSTTRAAHRSGRDVVASRPCTPFSRRHGTSPLKVDPERGGTTLGANVGGRFIKRPTEIQTFV